MITQAQKERIIRMENIANKGEIAILEEINTIHDRIDTFSRVINDSLVHLVRMVELVKKMKGDPGYTPVKGVDYTDGANYVLTPDDLKAIADSIKVPVVEKVIEVQKTKEIIIKEQPITINKTEIVKEITVDKTNRIPDIILAINDLPLEPDFQIDAEHIKNLPAKVGGLMHPPALGNLPDVSIAGILSGQTIQWDGNKFVAVTPSSTGFQNVLTGVVNGSNQTYTWTTAPKVIVVDGAPLQKVDQNGDVNWIGTTTTVLTNAPSRLIFAIA